MIYKIAAFIAGEAHARDLVECESYDEAIKAADRKARRIAPARDHEWCEADAWNKHSDVRDGIPIGGYDAGNGNGAVIYRVADDA